LDGECAFLGLFVGVWARALHVCVGFTVVVWMVFPVSCPGFPARRVEGRWLLFWCVCLVAWPLLV